MAQSVFLSATQAPSSSGVSDFLSLVFILVSSKNEPPPFDLDDLRNSVKDETENDFLLRAVACIIKANTIVIYVIGIVIFTLQILA